MISIVKAGILCLLTVLVLCLNINGKPIFHPIYSVLSHITLPIQAAAEGVLSSAFNSTQDYSKKIFNNSVPKVKDAVKSRASGPKRATGKATPSEVILVEEKEELDELIKSHY